METITERLRKIHALAESGVEGERASAQRLLGQLCAKHGVTVESLTGDERAWHRFAYRDDLDRALLIQVVIYVCGTNQVKNANPRNRAKALFFMLTVAESIDVREAFEHYRKAWREHADEAMAAFVHANKLWVKGEGGESADELSPEMRAKIRRIAGMAMMTTAKPWERRLKLN